MSATDPLEMITILPVLAELASLIKNTRPDTVTIDGRRVSVDYHVEDATGVEYALIHVELPELWQAQIDGPDLDYDTFGELWSFALPLDEERSVMSRAADLQADGNSRRTVGGAANDVARVGSPAHGSIRAEETSTQACDNDFEIRLGALPIGLRHQRQSPP